MVVFRLGKTQHSQDLSGLGAKLFGGRWNSIGTACLYTSQSRSLSLLEYSVNVSISNIPPALSLTVIQIPDNYITEIDLKDLPENWRDSPTPSATKIFGTNLLNLGNSLVLKIPSAIIPQEFNFLLNPAHADSKNFKILSVEDFVYDFRLKIP